MPVDELTDEDLAAMGDALTADLAPVPWHGVLAPEGVMSGDRRQFGNGSLTWRDLPLPLQVQEQTADGHDGSFRVGNIKGIDRSPDGLMRAWGLFDSNDHADEAVRQIAGEMLRGVSVDVDSAEFTFLDDEGNDIGDMSPLEAPNPIMNVDKGRISGATLCSIPAFQEAFVSLGPPPADWGFDTGLLTLADEVEEFVSEKPWDGSASRYTNEQWKAATVLHVCDGMEKSCHKLPIKEPGGQLSRAGVHAAAARFNQVDAPPAAKAAAKSALRGAYKQLGEEVPDVLANLEDAVELATDTDVTLHVDVEAKQTDAGIPGHMPRVLKAYWTHGAGAAKINWGVSGDFNRCRALLGKYVPKHMLSGLCAKLHKEATGHWPGPGRGTSGETIDYSEGVSITPQCECSLTASASPTSDFNDPMLTGPTPLTVTPDGRVFGHLATWGTCHIAFSGQCITPPQSYAGYSYFTTGELLTADGDTLPVGQITIGTGHASPELSPQLALAHYDNTGSVIADIAAGEDVYGIWVAGRLRPGVSEAERAALMAAALSGDWRRIGGHLELIAALAVNVPGFPIPRVRSGMRNQRQVALVASGVIHPALEQSTELQMRAMLEDVLREDRKRIARAQRAEKIATSIQRDRASRVAAAAQLVHG